MYCDWSVIHMVQFKDLKDGKIKEAYSIRECGKVMLIKYKKDGTEYTYLKQNIIIIP